jgi:hypothetical protein
MHEEDITRASTLQKSNWVWRHRRAGELVVALAAVAFALAACGGSSPPSVASLRKSGSVGSNGGSTTTTQPTSNATALLNQWAACMRTHGDPNQADPTIDADKVIHITWNPAIPGGYNGTNKGGQGNSGPGQYCRSYLTAAQNVLRAGRAANPPDPAQLEKLSECMRANGIPDFPDPVNGTLSFNAGASGDLNPNDPTFQNASKKCTQRTGVQLPGAGGPLPPGTITLNGAGSLPNASAGAYG